MTAEPDGGKCRSKQRETQINNAVEERMRNAIALTILDNVAYGGHC